MRCSAAASGGELPASEPLLVLDTSQHGFLSQVVELIEQLTLIRFCQTGMMADPTVQRILNSGCNPAQTQAAQDVDSDLHTSSAAHMRLPSLADTLTSSLNNMTKSRAHPQCIPFQTQASKTPPSIKDILDAASCHDGGTGSNPQASRCQNSAQHSKPAADTRQNSIFPQINSRTMCEPVQPWPQPSRDDWGDTQVLASQAGMQFQLLMMGAASDSIHQQSIRSTLLRAIARALALSFTGAHSVFLLTSL